MGKSVRTGLVLGVVLLAVAAGCSSGDDEGGDGDGALQAVAPTTTTTAPLLPCSEDRHLAVFDINGTLTATEEEAIAWLSDPSAEPPPRAQAAELVNAYRDDGYEILYVTSLSVDFVHGGIPITDSLNGWLERNGFPIDGSSVATSSTDDAAAELSAELVDLSSQGVSIDAAYTDNVDDIEAFSVGGATEVFLIGDETAGAATTIPGDDLTPVARQVEAQARVCT
jgi:hypothetical protein